MTGTTQKPSPSLGRSASRGAAVTIGGQAIRIAVQLGSIVVLARLLAPADYGLLAMVTAIIGIGEIFRDFGLSSAAIQAKEITPGQKSNLFWMNAGIGLTLTLLVIAASWPIAAARLTAPPLFGLTKTRSSSAPVTTQRSRSRPKPSSASSSSS